MLNSRWRFLLHVKKSIKFHLRAFLCLEISITSLKIFSWWQILAIWNTAASLVTEKFVFFFNFPAATYFEAPCEQLSQCNTYLTGAKCLNGKCICPTDHHFIGTECIKSVRVGDICNSDKECQISREYVDKIVCVNNICKCTKDSYDISNVCVQNEETGGQKLIKPFDIFFLITLTVLFLIIFV